MSKIRKMLIVVMIVSCLLIAMAFEVKATSGGDPLDIMGNLEIIDPANEQTQPDLNITGNQTVNEDVKGPIIQPDTNTSENVSNTLPKTGVTEDITVAFFIIVCVVSAIYAYKKIRDYNI